MRTSAVDVWLCELVSDRLFVLSQSGHIKSRLGLVPVNGRKWPVGRDVDRDTHVGKRIAVETDGANIATERSPLWLEAMTCDPKHTVTLHPRDRTR